MLPRAPCSRKRFSLNALLWLPIWRSIQRGESKHMATATTSSIQTYLGAKADSLLGFNAPKISKDRLHLPGPDFLDRVWQPSDRNPRVLASLHRMFHTRRLAGT